MQGSHCQCPMDLVLGSNMVEISSKKKKDLMKLFFAYITWQKVTAKTDEREGEPVDQAESSGKFSFLWGQQVLGKKLSGIR